MQRSLPVQPLGHKIIRLEETPSTNSLVLETEDYLNNHGLVVMTPHQTAGRGRMGRQFFSFPGEQLLFSVVIHPNLASEDVPLVSLLAGVAVAEVLETSFSLRPELKWPNDVLLDKRKVCGILVEARHSKSGGPRLVTGIGLNCHGNPAEAPQNLRSIVTTIAHETGANVDVDELLQSLLTALQSRLTALESGDRAGLLNSWLDRARLAGRRVLVPGLAPPMEGTVRGLSEGGFLDIELDNGREHTHLSGELTWLD